MKDRPWENETSYPIEVFGWSNRSEVFVGCQPAVLAGQRGKPTFVRLLLIYVWRDNGENHSKKVTVKIDPMDQWYPIDKEKIPHGYFKERVIDDELSEIAEPDSYDERLFFNTGKWLSFEPQQIELYDRQIKSVLMTVNVPKDAPKEYDKGLEVSVMPKVINPPPDENTEWPIGGSSPGIALWLVD